MNGAGLVRPNTKPRMARPDSFCGALSEFDLPDPSLVPPDFLSSLDSEQTFQCEPFLNCGPMEAGIPLDGHQETSSYTDIQSNMFPPFIGMDQTQAFSPGESGHLASLGDACCTISLKPPSLGFQISMKPEAASLPRIKTEPDLPCGNEIGFLDGDVSLGQPICAHPAQHSWSFEMSDVSMTDNLLLSDLPTHEEEHLLREFSANLDQEEQLANYTKHQSQLGTIFEEPYLDLPEDMLNLPPPAEGILPQMDEQHYPVEHAGPSGSQPPFLPEGSYNDDCSGDWQDRAPTKKKRSSLNRSNSTQTEAQRARTRETARKLRQRKMETVQQLHQDVIVLAKENRALVEKLKSSVAVLDQITSQNKSLKSLLCCLHIDESEPCSPRLKKLMKLKKDLEERESAEADGSPEKTLDLADIPLMSQSGKAEPEIDHFRVPCSADARHACLQAGPSDFLFTCQPQIMN